MHINDKIENKAENDGLFAIAYAILQLAEAQRESARAIRGLDVAFIAERIDDGLGAIASAIRDSGE